MSIKSELQAVISSFFEVDVNHITDLRNLKGWNHVYSFYVNGEKYVIRKFKQPHPETAASERSAYTALESLSLTDEVLYLDDKGTKITRFIEGTHLGYGEKDQEDAINLLRYVHERAPVIPYSYNIFDSIIYWASLCRKPDSPNLKILCDYQSKIDGIKVKLDSMNITPVLCHGDPCVNGNMLRLKDGSIRIIDWEYAGMADPFQDIALASVHQGFENIDPFKFLQRYLQRKPTHDETFRLKAYITLGAFELAAWMINDLSAEEFQDWLAPGFEPFGLFDLSFCDKSM
jgi:thiamine kinase-like enzyme